MHAILIFILKNNTIMKSPYEYRAQARGALQSRWGEAAIVTAIIIALNLLISIPSVLETIFDTVCNNYDVSTSDNGHFGTQLNTLLTIFLFPIECAVGIAFLGLARGCKEELLRKTYQHTIKSYTRLLAAGLLFLIIIVLVAIPTLGIGAIILGYAYSMFPYLIHDYPELTAREALKMSRQMMRGYKWKLFVLHLSFIGWLLLCIVTLGIAVLFIDPYMQTASAFFYEDLKAKTIVEENEEEKEEVEATEVETVE